MTIIGWVQIVLLLTALTPLLGGYGARIPRGLVMTFGRFAPNFLAALFLGPLDQSLTKHLY